jgi:hypothetical protein
MLFKGFAKNDTILVVPTKRQRVGGIGALIGDGIVEGEKIFAHC